jgi:predicted nucleic acid-binding protein
MGIREKFSKVNTIALDTNLFIYAFEQHSEYGETVKAIFDCIEDGTVSAVASVITLTEILVKPIREGNDALEKRYKLLFTHFPNLSVLPIHTAIAERAANLRGKYQIKTPDALILATALSAGSELFITSDERLEKVTEVNCVSLSKWMQT